MRSISKVYLAERFAEQLGQGSWSYELVEVLSPQETAKMEPPKRVFERQPSFY